MAYVTTTPRAASLYKGMPYRGMPGLGDAASTGRVVSQAGNLASGAVPAILAAHAASVAAATGVSASAVPILGMSAAIAVPVIGAALVGVTMLAVYLISNSGCGQTCIVTSQWANKAEDALKQNLAAYLALPSPRTQAQRQVGLANFDAIWATLQQQCGQSGTGDAGKACISDRQAGACKWRDASGACFNWFVGYRDPIANDAVVAGSPVTDLSSGFASLGGSNLLPLALVGGLLALAVVL